MQKVKEAFIPPPNPNPDIVQKTIGTFGRYHYWICFLVFLTKVPMAMQQMAIIFLAPKQPFKCKSTNKTGCPCPDPVYDTSVFTETIISKWNLICNKSNYKSMHQNSIQLGVLIGSITFGMASDRFGRKYPMIVAVLLELLSAVVAAYMPDFWSFTVMRFLSGLAVGGTMVIGWVIIIEYIGTEYRDVAAGIYQVPFNLGHLLMTLCGYLFRNYVHFQLSTAAPLILCVSYICLLPETPRWLLAVNKTEPAVKILERVAKINNLPTDQIRQEVESFQEAKHKSELKKGTVLDLFRTPNIRKNNLCMSFNWLSCSYCFYGVSQYIGRLSGDVFINVTSSAIFALMGTLLTIPLLKVMGRRTVVMSFSFLCAGCLFLLIVIPDGGWSVACSCIGCITSFTIFGVVYLYCGEMFPTQVRNAALGFSSSMARVGSMVAPYVVELSETAAWLPPLLFGIVPLFAGIVCFFMPETRGCELMTTIAEGEQFGKKRRKASASVVIQPTEPTEPTEPTPKPQS